MRPFHVDDFPVGIENATEMRLDIRDYVAGFGDALKQWRKPLEQILIRQLEGLRSFDAQEVFEECAQSGPRTYNPGPEMQERIGATFDEFMQELVEFVEKINSVEDDLGRQCRERLLQTLEERPTPMAFQVNKAQVERCLQILRA